MKAGDYVHFTKAHGHNVDIWAVVKCSTGRWEGHCKQYAGKVIAVIAPDLKVYHSWSTGSPCYLYDPPEQSGSWQKGWVRYTVVPEDQVPDEIWAAIARQALLA